MELPYNHIPKIQLKDVKLRIKNRGSKRYLYVQCLFRALFRIAKTWKLTKYLSTYEWIKTAIRRNEVLTCAITWLNFKNITLHEIKRQLLFDSNYMMMYLE